MIIPLTSRRNGQPGAEPAFNPDRHLAIEPPAWSVSLRGEAPSHRQSPASIAAPFRVLGAEGVMAIGAATRLGHPPLKFLAALASHPMMIDAVSALAGTWVVPAPVPAGGERFKPADAFDVILSLTDDGAWRAGFAMIQCPGTVLRQTGGMPAAYIRLTFLSEDTVVSLRDVEDRVGDPDQARVAWVRHKALITHRKLGRLIGNVGANQDRRALAHELWDALSDAEHAVEALTSESEGLDIFYAN
ncbi:hypothetical protein [Skermanella stibiiresistens]|nr:hypothetical protein [Skermanella stibiiresistens]